MKTGIELIAQERQKQIDKHGFTGEMETETVKTVKHTPLPWAAKEEYEGWSIYKPDREEGTLYIAKEIEQGYDMGEADAQFIVRACNSHYDLLEALKNLVNANPNDGNWNYQAAWEAGRKLVDKLKK